jgi:hypothetical protein
VLLQLNNVSIKDAKQFNALVAKLDPKLASVVLVRATATPASSRCAQLQNKRHPRGWIHAELLRMDPRWRGRRAICN